MLAGLACSHPGGSGHPTGVAGTSGSAGTTGSGGNSAGTAGTTGTPGTAGDTGAAGTSGTAGDSGGAGTTGAAGDGGPGTAGTTGAAGDSGGAGTTGAAGSGNAGTTGAGGTGSGTNLITNGDFSSGATNWHTESGTGSVNGSGAYCVSNPGAALIGWESTPGSPLMLAMGRSYRFSYQASGSGTVTAKVALAVAPYTTDFQGSNGLNSSLQTFTHTFTSPNNDTNTGLAFTFSNAGTGTVCIDNVTLVAN